MKTWEKMVEWGGFSVTPVRTGHKVESWSSIQGCRTGVITLVEYEDSGFSRDTDLEADHETGVSIGEHIATMSARGWGRVLRKGRVVQ